MKTPINNTNQPGTFDKERLPELELVFEKTSEAVWEELEAQLEKTRVVKGAGTGITHSFWMRISVAAVLVLVLGSGLLIRFYTRTVTSPLGQHMVTVLPDGSSVEMNAGSKISFKPLWWAFSREVHFEGEAFFTVEKGRPFQVVSSLGTTRVLGTSFNVYARESHYKVTCYTGKVRVVSTGTGHSLDLTAKEEASVNVDGTLRLTPVEQNTAPWMEDRFLFSGTPLGMVIDEIERQYNIDIQIEKDLGDLLYSGNFTTNMSVNQVLTLVCRPYGFNVASKEGVYYITKQKE